MLSVKRRKAAKSSHQPGHKRGEGEARGGAGQAGLTPCLTTPAPPPAATGESSQPTILSTGNNSELSGGVPSAASPRSSRETAHWGRRSRTTPRFPRHREMRAFVSCMA